jgi:hypothetical protein
LLIIAESRGILRASPAYRQAGSQDDTKKIVVILRGPPLNR